MLVYAVLSLTVVRMLPVALALAGAGFDRFAVAFVGWFGPRGLASVIFALLAMEDLHDAGKDLVAVIAFTVLLSVLAHGFSARAAREQVHAIADDSPGHRRTLTCAYARHPDRTRTAQPHAAGDPTSACRDTRATNTRSWSQISGRPLCCSIFRVIFVSPLSHVPSTR